MTAEPTVRDFDLGSVAQLGFEMFPVLNALREAKPVHWNDKAQCWVISRHQDILDALSGKLPLTNKRLSAASLDMIPREQWQQRLPNMSRYAPLHITNMDPPGHTRLRKLMTKAFGRPVVEGQRDYVRGKVAELMAMMRGGRQLDFTEQIACVLPGHVILRLVGMPESLFPNLKRWAHEVMVGLGTPHPRAEWVETADRAFTEMTEHFLVQIADRRVRPRGPEDFLTALVMARDGHDGMSDDEIVALLETIMVAGHDTTTNSIALGVAALGRHPEVWAYMRQNPDKMLDCVNEIMRYTAMSTAQNRVVAEDFEWHGKKLRRGDVVFVMFAAGNRDPRVYGDPEKFDPTRGNDASLTFGPGLHHCIGHLVAKMQLTEFFTALTREFNGVEILDEPLEFSPILVFRSIPDLRARFH